MRRQGVFSPRLLAEQDVGPVARGRGDDHEPGVRADRVQDELDGGTGRLVGRHHEVDLDEDAGSGRQGQVRLRVQSVRPVGLQVLRVEDHRGVVLHPEVGCCERRAVADHATVDATQGLGRDAVVRDQDLHHGHVAGSAVHRQDALGEVDRRVGRHQGGAQAQQAVPLVPVQRAEGEGAEAGITRPLHRHPADHAGELGRGRERVADHLDGLGRAGRDRLVECTHVEQDGRPTQRVPVLGRRQDVDVVANVHLEADHVLEPVGRHLEAHGREVAAVEADVAELGLAERGLVRAQGLAAANDRRAREHGVLVEADVEDDRQAVRRRGRHPVVGGDVHLLDHEAHGLVVERRGVGREADVEQVTDLFGQAEEELGARLELEDRATEAIRSAGEGRRLLDEGLRVVDEDRHGRHDLARAHPQAAEADLVLQRHEAQLGEVGAARRLGLADLVVQPHDRRLRVDRRGRIDGLGRRLRRVLRRQFDDDLVDHRGAAAVATARGQDGREAEAGESADVLVHLVFVPFVSVRHFRQVLSAMAEARKPTVIRLLPELTRHYRTCKYSINI